MVLKQVLKLLKKNHANMSPSRGGGEDRDESPLSSVETFPSDDDDEEEEEGEIEARTKSRNVEFPEVIHNLLRMPMRMRRMSIIDRQQGKTSKEMQ